MSYDKPKRKTRNRIRRLEKSISILEGIKYFTYPEDLAKIEKRIRHCKYTIEKKKLRYKDSLELSGAKKSISEIQQKIHSNKCLIKELKEKLDSIKSYSQNTIDSFDSGFYIRGYVYSSSRLKIIKSKEEIKSLMDKLIKLGKEQSFLKKDLKRTQRSLAEAY